MAASRTEPRHPVRVGWERTQTQGGEDAQTWVHAETGIVVVSAVDTLPFGAPRYCLAMRLESGRRCSASHVLVALADFDLLDAVEVREVGAAGPGSRLFCLPQAT